MIVGVSLAVSCFVAYYQFAIGFNTAYEDYPLAYYLLFFWYPLPSLILYWRKASEPLLSHLACAAPLYCLAGLTATLNYASRDYLLLFLLPVAGVLAFQLALFFLATRRNNA